MDFICETQKGFVAIECKAATRWDGKYQKGLKRIREEIGASKIHCYGVYQGSRDATFDGFRVLPVLHFLKDLWAGNILA